jgi:hypothetical protein
MYIKYWHISPVLPGHNPQVYEKKILNKSINGRRYFSPHILVMAEDRQGFLPYTSNSRRYSGFSPTS